jgi:hypothetical protein
MASCPTDDLRSGLGSVESAWPAHDWLALIGEKTQRVRPDRPFWAALFLRAATLAALIEAGCFQTRGGCSCRSSDEVRDRRPGARTILHLAVANSSAKRFDPRVSISSI